MSVRRGRGRKVGEIVNVRDDRGWRVPRIASLRRKVYDGLRDDRPIQQIAAELGITVRAAKNHRTQIIKWATENPASYARKKFKDEPSSPTP